MKKLTLKENENYMYFNSMRDYQDHLIIRQLKIPYLKSMKETQKERDIMAEIEFADRRNTKRMHTGGVGN